MRREALGLGKSPCPNVWESQDREVGEGELVSRGKGDGIGEVSGRNGERG
jgi:hypothetical protein